MAKITNRGILNHRCVDHRLAKLECPIGKSRAKGSAPEFRALKGKMEQIESRLESLNATLAKGSEASLVATTSCTVKSQDPKAIAVASLDAIIPRLLEPLLLEFRNQVNIFLMRGRATESPIKKNPGFGKKDQHARSPGNVSLGQCVPNLAAPTQCALSPAPDSSGPCGLTNGNVNHGPPQASHLSPQKRAGPKPRLILKPSSTRHSPRRCRRARAVVDYAQPRLNTKLRRK